MADNSQAIAFVQLHLSAVMDESRAAFAKSMKAITASMAVNGLLGSGSEIRARLNQMQISGAELLKNAIENIPDKYRNPETFALVEQAANQHFQFLAEKLPSYVTRGLGSAEGRRAVVILSGHKRDYERRLTLIGDGFGVAVGGRAKIEFDAYTIAEIDDWIRSTLHTGMKTARNEFMKGPRAKGLSAAFERRWREIKKNSVGRPRRL